MKYIFLAGAPGSRWSSVAKHLYSSPQINTSDSLESYTKSGERVPMHVGAYWDPGMGYGENFDVMDIMSTNYLEEEFDAPFKTHDKIKIIKSHQFSKYLEFIKDTWKFCPIVIAYRPNKTCYDWWLEAGGWNITYPKYNWYANKMMQEIEEQNLAIQQFLKNNKCTKIKDTSELGNALDLEITEYRNFEEADTEVYVYMPHLVNYFSKSWKGKLDNYKYSGYAILDKIPKDATVLDIGCGDNYFKKYFSNLTGIDPSNKNADIKVSLEEFETDQKYNVLLCLGSLNFGTQEEVFNQCVLATKLLKPGGTIYWRCNPGRHDHPHKGQEEINFFNWSFELHKEWAQKLGYKLQECKWDNNNRIYAEWIKLDET